MFENYHIVTFRASLNVFTALRVGQSCKNLTLAFFSPFITTQNKNHYSQLKSELNVKA